MRVVALLSLLSLAACVHSSHFYMPDGSEGFVIRCGGKFNDMSACYNRAYEECRGPYKILNGTDDQRIGYNYVNGQPLVVDHREITVVCGVRVLRTFEATGDVASESVRDARRNVLGPLGRGPERNMWSDPRPNSEREPGPYNRHDQAALLRRSETTSGCTRQRTNCSTFDNRRSCMMTSSTTYESDGSSAKALETLSCSSGAGSCISTYQVIFTRQ